MRNWDIVDETGQCVNEKDFADAELVCKKLKIPLIRIDFVKEYWNDVFRSRNLCYFYIIIFKNTIFSLIIIYGYNFDYFSYLLESYQNGVTPNPDIQCNKRIKFDKFYYFARNELKADAIATGHYVRTSFGPYLENYAKHTSWFFYINFFIQ